VSAEFPLRSAKDGQRRTIAVELHFRPILILGFSADAVEERRCECPERSGLSLDRHGTISP
jgi:hypothetical protein